MTVNFAKEYLLDDCGDCPENKNGECMTQSHCFEVKRMAIEALEQTRWIPISERLPKDGTWNIFTDGESISVERYKYDALDAFFPPGRWFQADEAIAWMPLPEPYKAEGSDKE